jgi:hypothetical protein
MDVSVNEEVDIPKWEMESDSLQACRVQAEEGNCIFGEEGSLLSFLSKRGDDDSRLAHSYHARRASG